MQTTAARSIEITRGKYFCGRTGSLHRLNVDATSRTRRTVRHLLALAVYYTLLTKVITRTSAHGVVCSSEHYVATSNVGSQLHVAPFKQSWLLSTSYGQFRNNYSERRATRFSNGLRHDCNEILYAAQRQLDERVTFSFDSRLCPLFVLFHDAIMSSTIPRVAYICTYTARSPSLKWQRTQPFP